MRAAGTSAVSCVCGLAKPILRLSMPKWHSNSVRAQAGWTSYLIGTALFFSRTFEEAIPRLRVSIEDTPAFPTPYRFLAACYAHLGLLSEARSTIARLRTITSEVIPTYPLPFRNPEHRELYFLLRP